MNNRVDQLKKLIQNCAHIPLICVFLYLAWKFISYPASVAFANRVDTEKIHVEELARYDSIHPLISVNGAHLEEN